MKIFGYSINLKKSGQGKPVSATSSKTGSRSRVSKVIRKQQTREVSYQIKDITTAVQTAENVDAPDRNKLFSIYKYIMKDGHLKSQVRTAIIKVLSEPWLLYKNGQPDLKTSELYNKTWFNNIIKYALESEWYGFSLLELDEIDPANQEIKKVIRFDRRYVSIERQWILIEGSINGDYLPYGEIMQELDLLEFNTGEDDLGSLLECAYNTIWKYYSRSDWARLSEKHGMPMVVIAADTNDDTELDDLEGRASNFGTDGYLVIQKEDTPTLLERKSDRGHDIYWDNIKLCNEEVSKIINGNTATTDQKAFVGSAEVQERTMDDFTAERMQRIVNHFNDSVLPYLVEKGFALDGYRLDYPRLKRTREQRINGIPTKTDPKKEDPKEKDDVQGK